MFTLIKFLKIVLPVATVTTATIATVSLVSFSKIDLDKTKDNEDQELNDFVRPNERHEEEKLFYSKDGDAEKLTFVSSEQAKQIEKALQEKNGELGKGKHLGEDVSKEVSPPRADEKTNGDPNDALTIPSKPVTDKDPSESSSKNDLDNGTDSANDASDLSTDPSTEIKLPVPESKPQELQSTSSDNGSREDVTKDQATPVDNQSLSMDGEETNIESKGEKSGLLQQKLQETEDTESKSVDNLQESHSSGESGEASELLNNNDGVSSGQNDSQNGSLNPSSIRSSEGDGDIHDLGGNINQYSEEEMRKLEALKSELSKFSSQLEGLIDLNN